MREKIHIILYCFIGLLLGGCIHEYPEEENADIIPVNISMDVYINMDLAEYQNISRAGIAAPEGRDRRFIIDVYREGEKTSECRAVTTRVEETGENQYLISVSLSLRAQKYTLVMWSDYVEQGTTDDLHFLTGDLANVSLASSYHPDHRQREAFCGKTELDLTAYRDEPDAYVHKRMELKHPQAKYKLIATDAREFIEKMKTKRGNADNLNIRIGYEYFFPTAYNVWDDVLCGSKTGISFTTPCNITPDNEGRCELVSDLVFSGGQSDSYVSLTFEVTDQKESVISRMSGVKVPLRQGHLTTVSAKFLTSMMESGVVVDTDYEGEFDIVIP